MTELNKSAISATVHCLTGCAIGEILGMIISTAFGWPALPSIILSILLAFAFGYSLTMWSIRAHVRSMRERTKIALMSDTASITIMEIADNLFILLIPGAIHAGLNTGLFWWSLAVSLMVAFVAAVPINRYLIARGKGHAVVHQHHHHHHED